MATILGITGGIGSGKTVVSQLLTIMGIPVYIADTEANKLTESDPVVRESLIRRFGKDLYAGNTLNRKRLASFIFNNEDDLKYVNSVVHPEVLKQFKLWTVQQSKEYSLLAIESAILFESGFHKEVDYTVNITAPSDVRVDRVIRRDNSSQEAVLKRINNQLSDGERSRMSDYIIMNDNTLAIIPQVESMINALSF